jgi:predicted RNA binding protein YcfA (HicA-like mRNA interferase family)
LGRLRILSGAEIYQILQAHGFEKVRQSGSHRIMQLRAAGTTVTVPVPMHDPVRRGTLLSIIRQSKLPKALFESE